MKTDRNENWKRADFPKHCQSTFFKNYKISVECWTLRYAIIFLLWLPLFIFAQTFNIQGIISTTDQIPVKYASVTFINQKDTTQKYSTITDTSGYYRLTVLTGIDHFDYKLPDNIELAQNYPNPFSASTSIQYKLNIKSDVKITIYDLLGREVRNLISENKSPGVYSVIWDGKNELGYRVSTGVYIYKFQAGDEIHIKKMMVFEGATSINVQVPINNIVKSEKLEKNIVQKSTQIFSETYTVEITNSDSIQPFIFPIQYEDVEISGDTTLNFNVNNYGSWRKLDIICTQELIDIVFIDDQNGWAVGDSGTILHTVDGGDTWQQQAFPFEQLPGYENDEKDLYAVEFIDTVTGFIGSNNSIFKTTDGGETWDVKYSKDLDFGRFHDIEFLNGEIGFAVGGFWAEGTSILLKTVDGGETWDDITPVPSPTLTCISIIDQCKIWICGIGSTLFFSADSGTNWTRKELGSSLSAYFSSIQFISDKIGWLGGDHNSSYSNRLLRTIDGGDTWIQTDRDAWSLHLYGVNTLCFTDSLNGWIGTFLLGSYAIAQTIDGGQTWEFLPDSMVRRNDLEYVHHILKIYFINKNLGWAVGSVPINAKSRGIVLRFERSK
ncbi:MAG TPA: YCF48-related protein [Candidatus Marinimicrobia bacterium]|nr:YCF48-related protein [Candidatus Neomarinimicrobiota bacterium]HRU91899.1 YCF48-related protein [Candidatus Neomarinimicrobiota bacterium]